MVRDHDTIIPVSPLDNWWSVIKKIEFTVNVTYDSTAKTFHEIVATHEVDGPDEAGRASVDRPLSLALREMVHLRFRFARAGAGLQTDPSFALSASGEFIDFYAFLPAGVHRPWDVSTERSYYNQAVTTQTNSPNTINTERKTENAGVLFDGLAGTLPGGNFRLKATLEVSSFTGGLDKSKVKIPIDVDGRRGMWVKMFAFKAGSVGLVAKLRGLGLSINGSGDTVAVFVRVD